MLKWMQRLPWKQQWRHNADQAQHPVTAQWEGPMLDHVHTHLDRQARYEFTHYKSVSKLPICNVVSVSPCRRKRCGALTRTCYRQGRCLYPGCTLCPMTATCSVLYGLPAPPTHWRKQISVPSTSIQVTYLVLAEILKIIVE